MKRFVALPLAALAMASCGTDVSGPSSSLLSCLFLDPRELAVGEVLQVEGAGNQALCLTGSDAQATFLYIPFFATAAPRTGEADITANLSIFGAGLATGAVAAAPAGAWSGASLVGPDGASAGPGLDFHRRLRQRELDELEPLIGAPRARDPVERAGPAPRPDVVAAAVPSAGDLLDFNVATSCTATDIRTGRVLEVTDHAIVVADTGNPAGLTGTDYAHLGATFDTLVHPLMTAHFGQPVDIDGNDRVIIFFTRAVNELSPADGQYLTAGFFWSGDLFPRTATGRLQGCPEGNFAEMFYMIAADPEGVYGPNVTVENARSLAVRILGHEYQHLINASRRLYVNEAGVFERPWLNEGLSHVAEELLFFEVSGLPRHANLAPADIQAQPGAVDAFNQYAIANFANFGGYLARPDTASLMGIDNLNTRGATWSFLRYAADRAGRGDQPFLYDLANSTRAGLENLDDALDGSALAWMRDWTVATYADDWVPGIGPEHTQPSWNFRAIYPAIQEGRPYPLAVRTLAPATPLGVTLRPGGAAFAAFGVPTGDEATIHVEADGRTPGRAIRGSILRVQ